MSKPVMHKTDNRKVPEGAIVAPLTVCGIMESCTRKRNGKQGRAYWWSFRWKNVTCKRCLASKNLMQVDKPNRLGYSGVRKRGSKWQPVTPKAAIDAKRSSTLRRSYG